VLELPSTNPYQEHEKIGEVPGCEITEKETNIQELGLYSSQKIW